MYGEGYWPRKILRIPLKFSYRNSLSNLLYGEGYWTRKILKIPSNLSYRNSLSSLINIALHITVALFIQCFLFRRPINGTLAVRPDYTQGHDNSCGEEKKQMRKLIGRVHGGNERKKMGHHAGGDERQKKRESNMRSVVYMGS